jgi:enoyl-CoA hydratase/carnithine racemase
VDPADWKDVTLEVNRGVATVTLNRPAYGNAWTHRMEYEYRAALSLAEESTQVGVIVLTGAGKSFCVGADRRAVEATSASRTYDGGEMYRSVNPGNPDHPAFRARHGFLMAMSKPVIAAVQGAAAGVGFVIMCFADIRFVADDAKLTTSTSRLGLPAEFGLSWILPRLIGVSRAMPILLGSPIIRGDEAGCIGLAHHVTPAAETLGAAQKYARQLVATAAPSSLRSVKAQVWTDLQRSLGEADSDATRRLGAMVSAADFRTGAEALLARKEPDFSALYEQS